MNESVWDYVHPEVSLATEKSLVQQVYLAVSVDKVTPEYLKASTAVNKNTTQQVSEETSEGTVANGKGHARASTPQSDCGSV